MAHIGTEHSCMFIGHLFSLAWFGLVWFGSFYGVCGITVCISLQILYVRHAALLVSERVGQDIVITAGQLDYRKCDTLLMRL